MKTRSPTALRHEIGWAAQNKQNLLGLKFGESYWNHSQISEEYVERKMSKQA